MLRRFRRAFALLFEHRRAVALGLACVPVSAGLSLLLPWLTGGILDAVASGTSRTELAARCGWFAAVALADVATRLIARHRLVSASRAMEARLKDDLMRHVGTLPVQWYDRARAGDLISRLTQDVELLRFVTGPALLHGGHALVVVPGGMILMFSLSVWVAIASLVACVALIASLRVLLPRLQASSKLAQEAIGALSQHANESFAGVRVLLAFARARAAGRELGRRGDDCLANNLRVARLNALVNLSIRGCLEFVILAVLVVGALEATAGRLSIGELLECYALLGLLVWPLIALGWMVSALPRAAAAADRIEELFALAPEPSAGERRELLGSISVRGLTFRHAGQDTPALRDVSFELAAGQKLGLVGPIGAGKSTLLAVLLRLYDPPRGTVFVDGHDVLDLAPRTLRAAFAFAPQVPFLFSDTVANNIEFGSIETQIERCVHGAALDADVDALPDGLDTIVGVRGITLSGGQKQRVALARALAADRPVLVLDDTLSAVDHRTEHDILARLRPLRSGRTEIVAAHRLSAVRDADLILVLEGGRVVAAGRHEELVRDETSYYGSAWRRQSEARALDDTEPSR